MSARAAAGLSAALAAVLLAGLLLCLYWAVVDRAAPATVVRGETVRFDRLPDGSALAFVRWDIVRHRACAGTSRRWLVVDRTVTPLPDISYPPDPPGVGLGAIRWEVPVEIPAYLLQHGSGAATYRITIEWACNPLQRLAFPIRLTPPAVPLAPGARLPEAPGGAPPATGTVP